MAISYDRFKDYAKEWFAFIQVLEMQPKDSPITLYEYIKLRAGIGGE